MKKLAFYLLLIMTACTLQAQELYNYSATVTRVYDGDTVWCDIDLGFKITLHDIKIRLSGIDTPEVRTTNLLEKHAGILVRDFMRSKLLNKEVILTTTKGGTSKYGEYLGTFLVEGVNLNQYLISKEYAKPYDGGTKTKYTTQDYKKIIKSIR